MGIDPREGTLLTLFAIKLARGASAPQLMESMAFQNGYVRDIARALAGEKDVPDEARAEANRIRTWANVPAT